MQKKTATILGSIFVGSFASLLPADTQVPDHKSASQVIADVSGKQDGQPGSGVGLTQEEKTEIELDKIRMENTNQKFLILQNELDHKRKELQDIFETYERDLKEKVVIARKNHKLDQSWSFDAVKMEFVKSDQKAPDNKSGAPKK